MATIIETTMAITTCVRKVLPARQQRESTLNTQQVDNLTIYRQPDSVGKVCPPPQEIGSQLVTDKTFTSAYSSAEDARIKRCGGKMIFREECFHLNSK